MRDSKDGSKHDLENLKERIEKIKAQQILGKAKQQKMLISESIVFNIGAELIAGVFVGVIIGLMLDKLFDSKPIFLIICLVISNIASLRSIFKKYIK